VILKGLDLRQTHAEWAVLYVHEETVRSFVLRMQPGHKKAAAGLPHSTKSRKNIYKNATLPVGNRQGKLFENV